MNPKLDDKLTKTFPLLYADRHGTAKATAMCWGFVCADGWFDLIWELSSKLEPLIQRYIKEHPEDQRHPRASQVKEKWGGLCFYLTKGTDEMFDLVSEAEEKSLTICEICGAPGKARPIMPLKTLCDSCMDNRMHRKGV